ncbi:MAG: dienelactone hydrolase family protein [Flavobacteriales bacterium]|jgi:dienelactone hydrolase|nr:dienelactone hydrolase family protein [Flavobacteriales bacterium]NCG30482.1 dienelactone hydrolase family protein [Bacteroidota bacterium]MBT3963758.1 dienelactone hydrolase family protein [Flavobacteriales bacterium]MBT4703947.1 dienelactone hydrolase family protein [Flavobacteriales bacterium]MBT4930357.1 dienelactone hydrolase family protein [Flavobacteriales bacterium]
MRSLIYLFLLLILSSCGTQHDASIVGEEIMYEGDSITMKGYLAYDKNATDKRPGIIVVHEWWGHNDHSRNSALKLAEAGYVAFALDMYGDGRQADHPEDAGSFAGAVMQNFDGAKERFNAAVETLKKSEHCDNANIGAIGYCFGGGVVLNMARQGAELNAVATFHGSIGPIEAATPGSVNARILVMNGADDPFVSAEAIESFKDEMDSAGVTYEFVNYPGAVHAFTNPGATEKGEKFDLPLAYNKEVDEESWTKLLEFLSQSF